MIKKEFQPTVPMAFGAVRDIFHSTSAGKLFYALFLGPAALLLLFDLLGGKGLDASIGIADLPDWIIAAGILVFILGFFPATQYRAVSKSWRSSPSASVKQTYEISESGVRNFGEGFRVELAWDKITRIKATKRFLLIFVSRNCAYFMPRSLLSDAEIMQIQAWKAIRHDESTAPPAKAGPGVTHAARTTLPESSSR